MSFIRTDASFCREAYRMVWNVICLQHLGLKNQKEDRYPNTLGNVDDISSFT